MASPAILDGHTLDPATVERIALAGVEVALDQQALAAVESNRNSLDRAIAQGEEIYGVTTGLGALVTERVPASELAGIQRYILRSSAAGVGAPLPREVVRAAVAIRLNGLLRAHSAVRSVVLERIAALLNADLVPYVPSKGSLGASGDLAPSAHAFLPLIGEGEFLDRDGGRLPAEGLLAERGFKPLTLQPKEALALINGTHFMTAIGSLLVLRVARLLDSADGAAAMTLDALRGFATPFDPRVHALRPVPGQARSAANIRALVAGSERVGSRPEDVQNAYSLRCVPQVHGAAREAHDFFTRLVSIDLNAVTDNPLVFDNPPEVLSAGNFHGQPLALAFDTLRIALADLTTISDRRSFRLVSPSLNGDLPPFLTRHAGHCGYMMAQYTGLALVAELKVLAQPVSIDSAPTSDNQEDHVSMGMTGALLSADACALAETVLAVEALLAAQGLETGEAEPGEGVARLWELVRRQVPPLDEDRPPGADIEAVCEVIRTGEFAGIVADVSRTEREGETQGGPQWQ